MRKVIMASAAAGLVLAGCGSRAPSLPSDPVEQAATCGVIAAATERGAAGVQGDLSPDAQARIFHYPLLAGSQGPNFDDAKAQTAFQRMPQLFDTTIKGEWQTLQPQCAAAYPAAQNMTPSLPSSTLDSVAQCYAIANFMRKALGSAGGSYQEAAMRYGMLSTKLDTRLSAALDDARIRSTEARKRHSDAALAAVAKLGQPPAVLSLCEKRYG